MAYTPNPVPQDVNSIPAFLSMELLKLADSPVKGDKGDTGATGATGATGQSQFTSYVFVRATSTPATPTGGSFASPVPSGWEDGIPTGTNPIYVSTRLFTSDGLAPQDASWSTPVIFAQNSQGGAVRYIFSSAASAPALPANSSTTGWNTAPDSTTIWMSQQVNTIDPDGSIAAYGAWQPAIKIKGETGATGATGATGPTGQRGSGEFFTSGSSWVDATADAAVTAVYAGGKVFGDTVTISNGTNFAMTKYWNNTAWTAPGTVIDGNLLVSGSVSAAKINANGLTIRDPSGNIILDASGSGSLDWNKINGTGKPENNATVGANGSNLSVSTSGNMLPNSDFVTNPLTNNSWVLSWNAGGGTNYTIAWDLAGSYWNPAGGHSIGVVRDSNIQAASSWFDIMYDRYIPMEAGISFELSAYLAAHRCGVEIHIAYYNSSYTYISENGWNATYATGGNDLNNWCRTGGIATTPANTKYARIFVRGSGVDAGQTQPYFWATKIFFGLTKSGQTQLSPWSASTSSGAFAELSQITPANASVYIASAAIGTAQIANAAITNALIANAAVGSANIQSASIGNAHISDLAASKLTTGTLSASTNLQVGTAARSGSTMGSGSGAYFEGTGGYFTMGNTSKNITFNGTDFYINGNVIATSNVNSQAITAPEVYTSGSDITIATDATLNSTHDSWNVIEFPITTVDADNTRLVLLMFELQHNSTTPGSLLFYMRPKYGVGGTPTVAGTGTYYTVDPLTRITNVYNNNTYCFLYDIQTYANLGNSLILDVRTVNFASTTYAWEAASIIQLKKLRIFSFTGKR